MFPIITCSISFARAASPGVGPKSHRLCPMASRPCGTHAASYAALEPPHRKSNVPSRQSRHPPETGAARKPPPASPAAVSRIAACTASPTNVPVAASTVEQSTYVMGAAVAGRAAIPATAASGPSVATAHAAFGSASMANTKSHCRVTSAGVDATEAPSARRGSVFATLRLYTVTLAPVRTRRAAICAPMMPSPRKPTLGGVDILGAVVVVGRRVTRARSCASEDSTGGRWTERARREYAGRFETVANSARRGVCRAERTHGVVPPSVLGFDRNARKHRDDADSTHGVSRDSAHTAGPGHTRARARHLHTA
jgi:hypothetical protein